MIKFIMWIVLCALIYIIPASIAAFFSLDWSYLDFTIWTATRVFVFVIAAIGSLVIVSDISL